MQKMILLLSLTIFLFSCKKDKQTSWDTEIIVPIVNSKLTVSELLKTDEIVENTDSSLKIVYSTELFSISPDSFAQLPDTTFEVTASLETLELTNDTIEYRITVGEIIRNSGDPYLQLIQNFHGFPFFISIDSTFSTGGGTFEISMSDYFDDLTIDTGIAEIILSNKMQFDLKNIQFQLGNAPQPGGDILLNDTFESLPKDSTESKEYTLDSGTVVLSDLIGEIVSIDVDLKLQAGITIIDTSEYISALIIIKKVQPTEATAIWPDQNIIEAVNTVPFAESVPVDFKDATVRDGELYLEIESTINDSIFMTYTIPNLVKDGVDTFSINVVVPPSADSSEGNRTTLIKEYPMDGYHFIFNGDGYKTADLSDDLVNSYVTELTARIKYTGEKKRISLKDRIYVNAQVRELLPVYANGFLRRAKVNSGMKNVSFDIFNQIESGNIDIEDVDFSIEVDNGIGASAEARFIDIKGTSKNGDIVAIDFEENSKMNISSASFLGSAGNFRTTHVTSFKNLNKNNSNIDKFIENLPVNIDYEVEVELNSNINIDSMTPQKIVTSVIPPNFLHYLDEVSAKLNIEVPLSVVTDSLVLIDTLDFNLNTDSESEVESGKFKLLVDNGFPFDANTALYFMDDMGMIIDSLWTNETILRASVNNAGKVSSSTRSVIEFTITAEKMDIIKSATKLYIEAGFHTFDISDPGKKFFKIYSNYSFAFKLIGDFNYQLAN